MRPLIDLPRTGDLGRFYNDYFLTARPVVVEGAARRMLAFERWTDEYLLGILGAARPTVRLADGRTARMPFPEFLAYLAAPDGFHSSLGPLYLTDFFIHPSFDDPSRARLAPEAACPLPRGGHCAEWISLYAGPSGTATPMHQDVFSTKTWLAQLRGEKTWRLCPPDGLDSVHGGEADAFGSDDLGCDVYGTILVPGDVIYVPPDWWHQVRNETSSTLAVSGNFCTFAEARLALEAAIASEASPVKDSWIRTWTAVLAQEGEGCSPLVQ